MISHYPVHFVYVPGYPPWPETCYFDACAARPGYYCASGVKDMTDSRSLINGFASSWSL